ncbi:MAG TPA: hypothetical protein VN776_10210 [Terracidiphilus sp.]|nr:hypothetical protein [Terracidiphilus sp.]
MYWLVGTILNPEWLASAGEFMAGIGGLATAGAVIVFGILGLRQYKEGLRHYQDAQRLKAADMLLEMEKEYREVLPVCIEFEMGETYDTLIKPILTEIAAKEYEKAELSEQQLNKLKQLDRALRFFYACSVLNGELQVEQDVIGRVYYYYLSILADPDRGKELSQYVEEYYPRLHDWLKRHKSNLARYKKTGEW